MFVIPFLLLSSTKRDLDRRQYIGCSHCEHSPRLTVLLQRKARSCDHVLISSKRKESWGLSSLAVSFFRNAALNSHLPQQTPQLNPTLYPPSCHIQTLITSRPSIHPRDHISNPKTQSHIRQHGRQRLEQRNQDRQQGPRTWGVRARDYDQGQECAERSTTKRSGDRYGEEVLNSKCMTYPYPACEWRHRG